MEVSSSRVFSYLFDLQLGPAQESEAERLILEYKEKMSQLDEKLESRKQAQLEEIRAKLLNKRRKERKDLHNAHITEALGRLWLMINDKSDDMEEQVVDNK